MASSGVVAKSVHRQAEQEETLLDLPVRIPIQVVTQIRCYLEIEGGERPSEGAGEASLIAPCGVLSKSFE